MSIILFRNILVLAQANDILSIQLFGNTPIHSHPFVYKPTCMTDLIPWNNWNVYYVLQCIITYFWYSDIHPQDVCDICSEMCFYMFNEMSYLDIK